MTVRKILPTSSSSLFFIRGVKPDFTITEELLSIRSLHGSTKGAEIFQQMMTVLKDAELDPAKLVGVATDGAPSMLGLGEGLQGHITRWRQAEELKPVVWHHCIVHQENLVAKSLKFKHVTDIVFSTVRMRLIIASLSSFLLISTQTTATSSFSRQCAG